jgi:hypothetical protein
MICDRCKRQLEGTIHTKDSYRIDLYRLWTGKTAPVVFKENGDEENKFLMVEDPTLVTVCVKCFHDPAVAEALSKFEPPPVTP